MPAQIKSLARRTTNGVWVNHLYLQHNDPPSSRLMVILPGQGYTAEHPVLYYLRKMALSLNYDVLSVQYSFQAAPHEISPSDIGWHSLLREVSQAVESVMHPGYTDICFAGKSLGTPLAVQQAQAYSKVNASLILLTPIRDVVSTVSDGTPTLAIIGTGDALYDTVKVEAESQRTNITWKVFDGLTHSLERREDWKQSLAVLPEIIGACEGFLRATNIRA